MRVVEPQETALRKIEAAIGAFYNADEGEALPVLLALANSADPDPLIALDNIAANAHQVPINPVLSDDELAAMNDGEGRAAIRNYAAARYYFHFLDSANNDVKKAALKAIADKRAGAPEGVVHVKERLNAQREVLCGPNGLNDGLDMLQDEYVGRIRSYVAERYARMKISEIQDPDILFKLVNVLSFSDFRKAINDVDDNDFEELKIIRFGASFTEESVLSNRQLIEMKRFVVNRHAELVANQRVLSWTNSPENIKLNGAANPAKDPAFLQAGCIKPTEFLGLLPELVGNVARNLGVEEGVVAGEVERARKSMSIVSNVEGFQQQYTVELPGKIKLTEKAVGKNSLETKVSTTSDAITPEQLFFIMAKNMYLRYKNILKMDPETHELKITELPTFTDKKGKVHKIGEDSALKVAFDQALQDAGFRKITYAQGVNVRADLVARDPAAMAAPAA